MKRDSRLSYPVLVDGALFFLLFGLLFSFLDPSLLFSDTIVTGGDSAAWQALADHLTNVLLPNGRLTGWYHGNFCGYPNFTFYFIPPFLLAALPCHLFGIPLSLALKWAMISGVILFPIFTYVGLRLMRYPFPGPILGAWSAMLLLFNEMYDVWGGNVLSTIAGEFCYMFAFALLPLFMGLFFHGARHGKYRIMTGLLLGLIGLSHPFVFLPAIFVCLYVFFFEKRTGYVMGVLFVAFVTMAFWALPLVAYRHPYTTPVYVVWREIDGWPYVAGALGVIVFVLAVKYCADRAAKNKTGQGGVVHTGVGRAWGKCFAGEKNGSEISNHFESSGKTTIPDTRSRFLMWVWFLFGCCCLYYLAHFLSVPDIRFLPPAGFALSIIFFVESLAAVFNCMKSNRKVLGTVTTVFLISNVIVFGVFRTDGWFRYTFEGYEKKPGYQEFKALNDYLRAGDGGSEDPLNAPRVAYEKSDLYKRYGGGRVFESIPYFSGRQTLDGVHYASALGSRFTQYLHTKFSEYIQMDQPLIVSKIDIESLPAYFDLYNISQIVVISDRMKKALDRSDRFLLEKDFQYLTIYRYPGCENRFVDVPSHRPVLYMGKNWVDDFYGWFKNEKNLFRLMVPERYVKDPRDREVLGPKVDGVFTADNPKFERLDRDGLKITSKIEPLSIKFTTNRPGIPHLIKVSYFPNWKVHGAHGVYPVSPHLMLVIPRQNEVTLIYGKSFWETVGSWISYLGGLAIVLIILSRPFRGKLQSKYGFLRRGKDRLYEGIEKGQNALLPVKRKLGYVFVVSILLLAAVAAVNRDEIARTYFSGKNAFLAGENYLEQGQIEKARAKFLECIDTLKTLILDRSKIDNKYLPEAIMTTGRAYQRLDNFKRAIQTYRIIIREYPDCRQQEESRERIARIMKRRNSM